MRPLRLPLFPLCLGLLAAGMLVPSAYAAINLDGPSLRAFLPCAVFTGFAAATLGVALASGARGRTAGAELRELVACWILVPLFAALPLWLRTPVVGFGGAWFDMLCVFTTTGGTVYAEPDKVPMSIHLWRGIVAWFGGLVTLAAAFAILGPRNLSGTETALHAEGLSGAIGGDISVHGGSAARIEDRLARALRTILPVYAGLTAGLALLFATLGQDGMVAAIHAMAILSTTSVSPNAQGLGAVASVPAEMVAALFLVLAATRLTYSRPRRTGRLRRWTHDPELLLMGLLVALSTFALFLRHWFGALTADTGEATPDALRALWGAAFTSLSFLTTTGFESAFWQSARDWSGLDNPGLILLGLCAIGGGAATTAGGIKLIRGYALLRHGYRELERIAQPNSVLATGRRLRGIMSEGAFLAWAFIMLYVVAIFFAVIALTLTGFSFEDALIASIAAISNTGPAFAAVAPGDIDFPRLSESQRAILGAVMVLGRLETLAVISLFNTGSWRRFSIRTKNTGNADGKIADSRQ